ncbi:type I 3-dehydroquinate dehydratase [Methanococcoides burtonii]|uniref:3-dehydroquinate dehydratase n=1 Tax=Methanococcoides burtonii (strain DSM 6242 / NBRC 107633 / OCM 468 / ACE-M) TaxID=259564 RepID=AROD_METBU|nr:type I 3-dehydroquinate dehydratase [Methanococcoides burtonii]Q12UJ8.1 RecName: Full=3-dehydroquinate dehydratase; Short=3-dehydroquinase; AltName: Full=Type I DHQase; AltName: Full=Type I dehydroquinase; Short=DHQ1 [Methanococcoides burtonii DSM 6242]ABE52878.1 3-dehydroquinate dehydratase [Methanococcoides burtonii DSM 6242]
MLKIGTFDLEERPAIVAAISNEPLQQCKTAAEHGADILEIRFDLLGITTSKEAANLLRMLKGTTSLPCIATNRLQSQGGNWEGTEENRIALLEDIMHLTDAVDIELETDEQLRDRIVKKAKEESKTTIISSHDFERTPDKETLKSILDHSHDAGADIAKLAVMPENMQDVLNLLEVTLEVDDVCTISMGKLGKHTRIIAPLYGSKLTYASVSDAVAPGQLKVEDLKKAMEMME